MIHLRAFWHTAVDANRLDPARSSGKKNKKNKTHYDGPYLIFCSILCNCGPLGTPPSTQTDLIPLEAPAVQKKKLYPGPYLSNIRL